LLPFGTPEEIQREVVRILDTVSENGGYIAAPSHNIQAGTPAENMLAFYDTVIEYAGRYI
jgi:uroporphyrinogen decarboxylase